MFKATDYWITIAEMASFQRDADRIFTDEEREKFAEFVAVNPAFGDIIPGTGGVRKIRWAAKNSGKRGGARVIYYFRDLNMPVYLLAVYAKGQKMNLTADDRHQISRLVDRIVEQHASRFIALHVIARDGA
jgi:mRNA-degrading endonuclease RelE of RelBE toxin-antitoxin system